MNTQPLHSCFEALDKREMFGDQGIIKPLFGDQTFYRSATVFGAVRSCLIVFDKI